VGGRESESRLPTIIAAQRVGGGVDERGKEGGYRGRHLVVIAAAAAAIAVIAKSAIFIFFIHSFIEVWRVASTITNKSDAQWSDGPM